MVSGQGVRVGVVDSELWRGVVRSARVSVPHRPLLPALTTKLKGEWFLDAIMFLRTRKQV